MSLLQINGVEVKCDSADYKPVRLSEVVRAASGRPIQTNRVRKDEYSFHTSELLSISDAARVRALIEGDGHLLNFEDDASLSPQGYMYTSRELKSSEFMFAFRSTDEQRHGSASLRLAPLGSATWTFGDEHQRGSFLCWFKAAGGEWIHLAGVEDASTGYRAYKNGAPLDLSDPLVLHAFLNTGSLILSNTTGNADVFFDEVVYLPYPVPSEWVESFYNFSAAHPWPSLPEVYAEGGRIPGGLTCLGQCGAGRTLARLGSIAETFEFTLYGK